MIGEIFWKEMRRGDMSESALSNDSYYGYGTGNKGGQRGHIFEKEKETASRSMCSFSGK